MGIEESVDKACEPAELMVVLGILFNTRDMTLSLTKEKKWKGRTHCSMKQLQSLVGRLNFAAGVIKSGRVYMARLINNLRNRQSSKNVQIILSKDTVNDVLWWMEHVHIRNEIPMQSLMINKTWEPPGSIWSSDSSKTGLGGWAVKTAQFYHHALNELMQQWDINSLECFTLLLCLKKWGSQCRGKRILVYCDNTGTVLAVNSGSSKSRCTQACLRELHHICALNSVEVCTVWLKTEDNSVADALSRWDQNIKYQEQFFDLTREYAIRETVIEPEDLTFSYTTL